MERERLGEREVRMCIKSMVRRGSGDPSPSWGYVVVPMERSGSELVESFERIIDKPCLTKRKVLRCHRMGLVLPFHASALHISH